MRKYLIILCVFAFVCLSNAESCNNFFFSFRVPKSFVSQDIRLFSTDISAKVIKYIYTFGNGANIIITAKNHPTIENEYTSNQVLNTLKTTLSDDKKAAFKILINDAKEWAYAKSTRMGTGGKWTENGQVITTRGYFMTANGPDLIGVILTAPAASYNNYEDTIINFVSSIKFSGQNPLNKNSEIKDNTISGNTGNSGNNTRLTENTNTTIPTSSNTKVPSVQPSSLSNQKFIEDLKISNAYTSAFAYFSSRKFSLMTMVDKSETLLDFAIYINKKLYRVAYAVSDNEAQVDGDLVWTINKSIAGEADIILLMRKNRVLKDSWMVPVRLITSKPSDNNDYIIKFSDETVRLEFNKYKGEDNLKCFE